MADSLQPQPLAEITPDGNHAPGGSRRGKGFLALGATMFLPGAGQFLAGRRRRGLLWLGAAVLLTLCSAMAFVFPSLVPSLILFVPAGIVLSLAGWIDSFLVGRKSPRPMLSRPAARYGIGATLLLLALFANPSMALALYLRANFAEAFLVPTAAMSPTIIPNDRLVCHKRLMPKRWDVVVLLAPEGEFGRSVYVERLIGLPGEEIELRDGFVHLNGQRLDPPVGIGPYESNPKMPGGPRNGCEGNPIHLGSDEYYFLGDNSPISGDSRYWLAGSPGHQPGTVGRDDIIGVATYTYWPPARWRRLAPKP